MDNGDTEQTSNNESGASVKTSDVHNIYREGDTEVHDFSYSDGSSGTETSSRISNDSSKYSLGVDLGTDSQSKPADSRYSLGVDTSLSGGSKSQADRTETERSSRSNLPHNGSWTSSFLLGLDENLGVETRQAYLPYSLKLDESLRISSESPSPKISLGIFETTSSPFPLRTGEKASSGDKPAEKLPATPRGSNINSKNAQQQFSPEKSDNSVSVTDKIKGFIRDISDQIKGYAKDVFKVFEDDDKTNIKQEANTKQQIASPQKSLLSNPVPEGQVGSSFGFREDPLKKTAANKMHWGLDIKAPKGTRVLSAGEGKATVIEKHKDYGNFVVVDHGNGLQTAYAHMDSVSIKNGESVKQGQEIGEVGNTGRSTGSHLHFEVRNGDNRGASFHSKSDKEKYYKDPKDYVSFEK
jgi:murein DD-endopeptidase MepM/ murein hydrolase activator NlpD